MAGETYNIIFTGAVLAGHDEATVRASMAQQFKLTDEQLARMFSGRRSTLKKGLDADGAARFEKALNAMGAAVTVEVLEAQAAPPVDHDMTPAPPPAAAAGAGAAMPAASGGHDPYAPPSANVVDESDAPDEMHEPRRVPFGRGATWIAEGWGHFKDSPGPWIGLFVVFSIIYIVPGMVPIVGQIVSLALWILWPVFLAGIMLAADRQRRGVPVEINTLFEGFTTRLWPLTTIGLVYFVGSLVVMIIIGGATFVAIGGMGMMDGNTDPAAAMVPVLLAVLLSMALLLPLVMTMWFAPALVILHDVSAGRAMQLSFTGCLRNFLPFLLYGLLFMILYVLGIIPLLLGLLVVGPVLLASIYTSYRDIYVS